MGLVTDESGWYVHVYNNSSTTGVRPAFIIYVGFDGQNNNYIYTGRNHTLGTIPAETYTSNSFGNKMIASPDGGLILLIGRPFNGTHLAKFDSDLTLLYHSADLAMRPGYVGEDASVIELDIFLSSVVSGGQGKYYLAGVADIFDGTYEAIDFMVEAEDTGTFFTDNGYSEILAVPAVNGGSGYADIADGFYSDGKIYWCGTIYDEPETSGSNYGRVILRVDADSKDVDWVVRDYTDTVDGLNDLYHVFVLGERVYVAGVTGDTSILRNSVYVYSSEDGSFIEGIFPSDYSPTLSKESSIL